MVFNPSQTAIGLIGTGVMGKSMASHFMQAGYQVHIYNRTKSKAQDLIEQGALWQASPGELAEQCQVIVTMVGFPSDVEEIYFGQNGILAHVKQGSYLVDMTTSSPILAKRIYDEALSKQVFSLDAPVSGGDIGAREARLSIMVGGDREVFDGVLPLLEKLGTNIVYQGAAGAGQHTKMCNQIAIASNMMGVVESLVYAQKAGLDPTTVLKSIESGAAGSWSLSNLAPRIIAGNFAPGFYVKHFIKDMKIALQVADEMNLTLPGLSLAKSLYEQLAASGEEDSGTHALFKLISN
ncbi:3-hydroxyisobutyrate dehydrogenase [Paenibacillus marchantiophytorum]|uniref:3-hydroxyisobutyrate dehydrogenase n=1 Tax=Paenibacillus marchantiophytorum TaxID=1619310 RepID=A0ABQ1FKW0_9BACL|nr:NAD(P)-dependent oxidoreductase [Paenibacillus marchantiophytorum]GGA17342.1 3-hydroxyisobutyrate dehydrogenase [Paenibacillus marchantiophytorum]